MITGSTSPAVSLLRRQFPHAPLFGCSAPHAFGATSPSHALTEKTRDDYRR